MNPYWLIRPLLFKLDPETAHDATLKLLQLSYSSGLTKLMLGATISQPLTVMGLKFTNPLGLAAGLDKNGDYLQALAALGFGFIEIGTITPRPQPGNAKPRLFRLAEHQAIINRMGFNNLGIDHLLKRVQTTQLDCILGINIGKNLATPIAHAADDYLISLRKAYPFADYIAINISSPNTRNLRQLQQGDEIRNLLAVLKEEQGQLQRLHKKYVPLVVKIAPDLDNAELVHIAKLLLEFAIDGVIATNTTIDRDQVKGHCHANESGGLSGTPLKEKSTAVVKTLTSELQRKIPIIAVGGISSAADAQEKFDAGASLVQIYSGLIYQGPKLVKEILKA